EKRALASADEVGIDREHGRVEPDEALDRSARFERMNVHRSDEVRVHEVGATGAAREGNERRPCERYLARLLALDAVQRGVSDPIDPSLDRVRSVAISKSGRSIAALGADGNVRWWSLDTHEARSKIIPDAASMRFERSEKLLAVRRFTGVSL